MEKSKRKYEAPRMEELMIELQGAILDVSGAIIGGDPSIPDAKGRRNPFSNPFSNPFGGNPFSNPFNPFGGFGL